MTLSVPAMAGESSKYKQTYRSGGDLARIINKVGYAGRRHERRERHSRRDYYNSGRHGGYNKHRYRARHGNYRNRHNRHGYRYNNPGHSYWGYPLSSYSFSYRSSPHYTSGFRYYDW